MSETPFADAVEYDLAMSGFMAEEIVRRWRGLTDEQRDHLRAQPMSDAVREALDLLHYTDDL